MTSSIPLPASPEALFRFAVVSQVLSLEASGEEFVRAVRAVADAEHPAFDGTRRKVGLRTVYRWVATWRKEGMEGLEPAGRPTCEGSEVLDKEFLDFLREQKTADARSSLPEIIKRARANGILGEDDLVDRSTVWRAARRLDLETRRRKKLKDRDVRRFAYAHRMQMMLCDGKHFRAGVDRLRRLALFFLDDATRFGLHVVVGTSENTPLFLRGLYETVRRHGLMDMVYLDRGPAFIAQDTGEVVRRLSAAWVLGEAGYPPARGAIERFNQTAENALLRFLDGRVGLDSDCGALELRLQHWLREVYNHEPHEGLGGLTPLQRWQQDDRQLRFPENDADLRDRFVCLESRRVTADNTVSLFGVDLEVPRGHAGGRVVLHRHLLTGACSLMHEGRLVTLAPVDTVANASSKRARTSKGEEETDPALPLSAAEMAFQRDLCPVVGPDGGFSDNHSEED